MVVSTILIVLDSAKTIVLNAARLWVKLISRRTVDASITLSALRTWRRDPFCGFKKVTYLYTRTSHPQMPSYVAMLVTEVVGVGRFMSGTGERLPVP
jgi:hypothetical protein